MHIFVGQDKWTRLEILSDVFKEIMKVIAVIYNNK